MCVELSNERVAIRAVNDASHFDAFAAGSGAAEAVHTDFKEEFCCFAVCVEDIADNGIFCNFHDIDQAFLIDLTDFFKKGEPSLWKAFCTKE